MLNGDAHHSGMWEFELRIWPLPVFKDLNAGKDTRKRSTKGHEPLSFSLTKTSS
jgi:hypothetical protein